MSYTHVAILHQVSRKLVLLSLSHALHSHTFRHDNALRTSPPHGRRQEIWMKAKGSERDTERGNHKQERAPSSHDKTFYTPNLEKNTLYRDMYNFLNMK